MNLPVSDIKGYHAHIYFSPESRGKAEYVREKIGENFDARLGRWHEIPIGPHPKSMYQVAFATEVLSEILPWLMLNRQGLDILVHTETGNDLADHTENALWLGTKLELDLSAF